MMGSDMRIALLCPTRERINKKIRLLQSLRRTTADYDNITLYFGVDDDDPNKIETYDLSEIYGFVKIIDIHNKGEFLGLGKLWNLMVKYVQDDILAMVGDDMVFYTEDWDQKILREFDKYHLPKDKFKLVHCNDGYRGPGNPYAHLKPFPVNSFIHRVYYDTVGYYVREEWKHGWQDTWLNDVFGALDRKVYRHDIMIKHMHWTNPDNKTEEKDSVSMNLEKHFLPKISYDKFKHVREKEVELIRNIINCNDA